jgi:HAD superfamily hydrolase (TIGR01509 family)
MKALLFDMDGLMIDSERLYFDCERQIAARFNKTVNDRTLWKMMGRKPIESISIFIHELGLNEKPEVILELRDSIMREKLENDVVPMPGLFEIIDRFYRRMELAIATGAPQEFLDIVLDRLGLREKFSMCQTSDNIRNGKPHPETYQKTCQRLGFKSSDCIVLEDSSNGVVSGKGAGCYTIAVPSVYSQGQDFSMADFSAENLIAAREHIEEILNK